jgi:AcrR family transcriptional regulator
MKRFIFILQIEANGISMIDCILQKRKLGRPKHGTEQERIDELLEAALDIFLRFGYANTSIAKISSTAGVSTRTIYGLYTNKSDLMVAAVTRMVEQDLLELSKVSQLSESSPEETLTSLCKIILERVTNNKLISLYRMGVSEGFRFPELAKKMRSSGPKRIEAMIADYLNKQSDMGILNIQDAQQSASLFLHMLISEPRHNCLFGLLSPEYGWNAEQHIANVVRTFLYGTLQPKSDLPK